MPKSNGDGTTIFKPKTPRKDKAYDICWNCGIKGHHTNNCLNRDKDTGIPLPGYPNKEGLATKDAAQKVFNKNRLAALTVGAVNDTSDHTSIDQQKESTNQQ